ncbi:MAG: hypothetical protein ABSF34_14570, partial [Verrucomicrobiota bacterium]
GGDGADGFFRTVLAAQAIELGEEILVRKSAVTAAKVTRQKQHQQARRFEQKTGVALPQRAVENIQSDDAKLLADFLSDTSEPETAAGDSITKENGKIIYHLKPPGNGKGKL